jgi:molecular chaperone GrpE
MSGSDNNRAAREGGDEPVVINDKRRIDPETGEVRNPGGFFSSPFGRKFEPGDPNEAGQPITVRTDADLAVEAAQQEAAERTADLQRITAEYANYRKRVDRDREQVIAAAKGTVVTELLTVLDDLDQARAHGDLVGSFGTVAEKLTGSLRKLGLEPLGAEGDAFDPAVHEAVQFGTSAEVSEPTVTAVFRSGYTLGGRLLRPAVVVVTGPEHESAGQASGLETGIGEVGAEVPGPAAEGSASADPETASTPDERFG